MSYFVLNSWFWYYCIYIICKEDLWIGTAVRLENPKLSEPVYNHFHDIDYIDSLMLGSVKAGTVTQRQPD